MTLKRSLSRLLTGCLTVTFVMALLSSARAQTSAVYFDPARRGALARVKTRSFLTIESRKGDIRKILLSVDLTGDFHYAQGATADSVLAEVVGGMSCDDWFCLRRIRRNHYYVDLRTGTGHRRWSGRPSMVLSNLARLGSHAFADRGFCQEAIGSCYGIIIVIDHGKETK